VSPEKLHTIRSALSLQGELKMTFTKMGLGKFADHMASEAMDMIMMSDVVRPEIGAIYKEISEQATKETL
jgi:hypothetical protein